MELVVAYIAKALMLITSMILYVYLFSSIIPRFIMKISVKKENTRDRGVKKFIYPNGRCVLYETELAIRRYVGTYALYTEDGYKYIKSKAASDVYSLKYDVYAFNNKNKLIDIISVSETLGEDKYTDSVALPPETSYVRFVLRRVNNQSFSNNILAGYSFSRYAVCATVVALATAIEAAFIYVIFKDIFINALKLKIKLSGPVGMTFTVLGISLLVAGLTILAYRRNCKRVINR